MPTQAQKAAFLKKLIGAKIEEIGRYPQEMINHLFPECGTNNIFYIKLDNNVHIHAWSSNGELPASFMFANESGDTKPECAYDYELLKERRTHATKKNHTPRSHSGKARRSRVNHAL